MLLLELPTGQALEASQPMLALVGRSREETLAGAAPDFSEDPQATRNSLGLLATGSLDAYRRRVRVPRPYQASVTVNIRVDAWGDRPPHRLALATVLPAGGASDTLPIGDTGHRSWQAPLAEMSVRVEFAVLTEREREIALRLLDGQRIPTIARELFLSPSTVRTHLSSVYRTFRVCSQVELIELLRHS
ncbi:MAG: Response regulator containing a CheY-like receiver domain and an DNA-binding domain [Frankiales bacterium]|nr:Response regulator containing a CheY-like receiver domain and an DNA-binding domain [Frankiales bacterium]